MCGIAGCWAEEPRIAEANVKRMLVAQAHRGPDDEGLVSLPSACGALVFGHRRLSILDLSPAGHQPMENPATGDWIVFNGEIYNFPELRKELEGDGVQFRSNCDTEVILHAFARWNTDAFDRLHGMFALGLFDRRRQRLILARDPLGIKPLYYAWGGAPGIPGCGLLFASELRAMEAAAPDAGIDRRAWAGVMAFGAVAAPLSMLEGVRVLSPGAWASIEFDQWGQPGHHVRMVGVREQRYWDFPAPRTDLGYDECAEEEVAGLLRTAVRSHLMSDVPIGVFLSSGLDSTAIASAAAEARDGDIDTFTVALGDDPKMDESPIAQRTAEAIGARYHHIALGEAEVRRLTQQWLDSLDQPSVDGLNTYIISRAVRERGIVVALSGLGGDELFGGYPSFREVPRLARLARATAWIPRGTRRAIAGCLWSTAVQGRREKAMNLAAAGSSLSALYFGRRRLLSDRQMHALGLHAADLGLNDDFLPPHCDCLLDADEHDPVSAVGVMESRFYMGNMLLRDADVFGMAHGLEIRVPMLDRRLIDFVYSLPGRLRRPHGGVSKPLLARALPPHIPAGLPRLKKRGFALPQARWMAGPLRELFEDLLNVTRQSGLVHPAGVTKIWDDFLKDQTGPTWSRAWLLGVLGAWLRKRRHGEVS